MGTEALWVPLAISAVSAGAQAVNQSNANSRAQTAETQAIDNQNAFKTQANSEVSQLTKQIAQNSPQQIQGKETGDFVNTLRKNAVGSQQSGSGTDSTNFGQPVSALAPAVGASSRYNADTAKGQQQTQAYGNTYAGEEGAIDAAVRQRQNEGLAMQTVGTGLNQLQAQSFTQNFVDQLRAQTAGQTNPWMTLFANVAGNGANAFAKNPGMFSSAPGANVVGNGTVGGFSPNAANFGNVGGFGTQWWNTQGGPTG